jgi:hypothetical protein
MKKTKEALAECSSNYLFIFLFDLNLKTFPIYRKISHLGFFYAVLYINPFPIPQHYYKAAKKYSHYLKKITRIPLKQMIFTISNKFLLRHYPFLGVKPATLCLLGGTKSIDFLNAPIDATTQRIWMHSLDYDLFLQENRNKEPVDQNLCVFIEAYFPSDPDRYYHDATNVFDPGEDYYKDIRNFFETVEKKMGYRIIVAEHPKKHPDLNNAEYGDRETICGNTANLVKKARFVLSHDSNAINYAILFKKPIIFLTSQKIEKTSNGENINTIAAALGKNVIYIDSLSDLDLNNELTYDEQLYDKYIREYIKNSDENIPCWQIFANYIKKHYNEGNS